MLQTTQQMLLDAQNGHYAVGAFNIENMEFAMAVIKAAEAKKSPVILQTTPGTIKYASLDMYTSIVTQLAEQASVPVALHLDHGNSHDLCMKALRSGYTSVMIDGSHESFEDNIALTKSVCDAALAMGIPVEAELGKVGGKEDDGPEVKGESPYTDPIQAKEFVKKTGCTSLAVGVGTAHGVYKGTPHIAIDVLKSIHEAIDIPLVLHGTSGVPNDQVREAIANGVCKVNYATELRQVFTRGFMDYMDEHPDNFDPKKPSAVGMDNIQKLVEAHMDNLGSTNKA